jgi:hypothetical protein
LGTLERSNGSNRMNPMPNDPFWGKVAVKSDSECWLWIGATAGGRDNYGQIRKGSRLFLAHRISYEMSYGEIPVGMDVMHLCHSRACVNPKHLTLGSRSENMLSGGKLRRNNRSGLAGVAKHNGYWEARVTINNKDHTLYRGHDFFEACCARKSWEARQLWR